MNAHALRAASVIGLLLPALMNAQIDRSKPPAPGPTPSVSLGTHKTFELPNGFRVIVVENHKLPLVGVQVRFDIPPLAQGEINGYIELMGELLATGTAKRDKVAIDAAVDRMGANFFTSSEGAYASGLKRHLPALLELVTEAVTTPAFTEAELAKARKRAISEVQQRQEEASTIADAVGRSVTFGRYHPYGEVVTEESLKRITTGHLRTYHAKFFRPEKGYLVFVGDVTEKEVRTLLKGQLAEWKPAPVYTEVDSSGVESLGELGVVHFLKDPAIPKGPRRVVLVDRPGAAQSVIRVSFPLSFQPKDVRALNAQVMNTILGGGVFNARLMQNLREDKGWTYGTYSTLESDRFNGHFHTTANVRTDVTDSAIVETLKEIERMRTSGVTVEELDLAKRYMAGSFARSLEDPRTVARFALNTYLNELPEDHYATYLARLAAVTVADVQAAAEAFLHPDNAVIMVVGDKRKLMAKLEPLSMSTQPIVLELDHNGAMWVEEFEQVKDLTADMVIDSHLKAIGGRSAIGAIKTMRMELETKLSGTVLNVTQWYGIDGQFKSSAKSGAMLMQEEILDGERAVRKGPNGDVELEGVDLVELLFNGHPVPETHYAITTEKKILAGKTSIDGKPVYKVVVITIAGATVGDYYDATTGLKLRRVEEKYLNERIYTITTDYGDYQASGGVLFPRSIVQSGGPMGEMTLTVKAIEMGLDLKPGFFATGLPPKVEE